MTTNKTSKTPVKRRSVSKARLYKEILAAVGEKFQSSDGTSVTVKELLDALKDDIVDEALKN